MKSTSAGGPVAAPRVQDLLDSPLPGRKFDRELEVCEIARRVLSFCRYRRAAEHFTFARPPPVLTSSVAGADAPPSSHSTWHTP